MATPAAVLNAGHGKTFYARPKQMGAALAKVALTVLVVAAIYVVTVILQDWISVPCSPQKQDDEAACKRRRRAATIVAASMTFLRTVLIFVGVLVGLHHLGLRTTTLFALTSILSLVIGLAAQSMLRDLINGATFLAEEQLLNGDYVQLITGASAAAGAGSSSSLSMAINGGGGGGGGLGGGGGSGSGGSSLLSGIVESVSLRRIKLRNFDNELIYVPNSEVRAVINASQQYPVVRLRMSLSRTVDVDEALRVVREAGEELSEDAEFQRFYPSRSRAVADGRALTEAAAQDKATMRLVRSLDAVGMTTPEPEVLGVSDIGAVGVEIMVRFMTDIGKQWVAGRYARQFYLRRLAELGPVTQLIRVLNPQE